MLARAGSRKWRWQAEQELQVPASLLTARGSDFAPLRRQICAARLLDRRYTHYAIRIAVTLAVYIGAWWVAALLGGSWLQLIVAGGLGLVFTQVGFLGHDGAISRYCARGAATTSSASLPATCSSD